VAEPLKTFFSAALVRRLGADLVRVHPTFPVEDFIAGATQGLDDFELLDRGRHIARALATTLPREYPEAIDILLRSLGPELASNELIGVGMAPFFYLPHTMFVAERGLEHFDLSMRAQYELTKRFSAESSIRSFITKDPERAMVFLGRWIDDANPHVRRLVSEGTRLRLPWAPRVAWLDANPERVLELLEQLKDDDASLVRRSVANNLNDLGKVHPGLLTRTSTAWLEGASEQRRALVAHALRSALKRGEPDALRLLGFARDGAVKVEQLRITPRRVRIGGRVTVSFAVRNVQRTSQRLVIDVAVHFVKASGRTSRKVFRVKRVEFPPRGMVMLRRHVSLAVHTTRVPHEGRHRVDVLVNGAAKASGFFTVTRAKGR
jgi:3-methyladenine DNA glycosylase AlkC